MTLENLEIVISKRSDNAANGIDKLVASLEKLKTALNKEAFTNAPDKFTKLTSALDDLARSIVTIDNDKLANLSTTISLFTEASKKVRVSDKIVTQFGNIASAIDKISEEQLAKIERLGKAFENMKGVSFGSFFKGVVNNPMPKPNDTTVQTEPIAEEPDEAGRQLEAFQKKIKDLKSEFKQFAQQVKRTHGPLSQFLKSLGRIAFYRFIRSVIKSITQGLKEGVQNLARYSKAIGEVDSALANPTMSAYATKLLEVKNAVGAAVAPMLQSLLPVVQNVCDWFINATNAINQFISALQGKSTYTKAKEYFVDYADSLDKSTKSAKEFKNVLLGFDEINRLDDKSGSGSGKKEEDYSQMFEEDNIASRFKVIADKAKGVVDYIKENFDAILTTVGFIGAGIALWKVSQDIIDFAKLIAAKDIGLSIKLSLVGFAMSAGAAFSAGENGWDLGNSIIDLLGSALSAVNIGVKAGPWGAVGALALTLAINIIGYTLGQKAKIKEDFYNSEAGQELLAFKEEVANHTMRIEELKISFDNITADVDSDTLAKFDIAKDLLNDIFTEYAKDNKTPEEIQKIIDKIVEFNGLGLVEIQYQFDETGLKIENTREQIQLLMEDLLKQYQIEGMKDAYIKAYANYTEAVYELRDAEKARNDMIETYQRIGLYDTLVEEKKALENSFNTMSQYNLSLSSTSDDIAEIDKKLKELDETYGINAVTVKEYKKTMEDANEQIEGARDTVSDMYDRMMDFKNGWIDLATKTDEKSGEMVKSIGNLKRAVQDLNGELSKTDMSGLEVGVGKKGVSAVGFSGYASGGVVSSGDIFVANENGNAEMVGRFGNQTGVMNQGQIVDAVSAGVASAVAQVLNTSSRSNEVTVYLDGKSMAERLYSHLQSEGTRHGRSLVSGV